jgi:hypothetical protein
MNDQKLYEMLRASLQQPRSPELVRRVEALLEQVRRTAKEEITPLNCFERFTMPSNN